MADQSNQGQYGQRDMSQQHPDMDGQSPDQLNDQANFTNDLDQMGRESGSGGQPD